MAEDPVEIPQLFVEVKEKWGDNWRASEVANVVPVRFDKALSPAMPTALFRWDYGQLDDGDGTWHDDFPLGNYANWYVRICRPPERLTDEEETPQPVPVWHGVITGDADLVGGASDEVGAPASGTQLLVARGLECLLQRAAIDGSYVLSGGSAEKIDATLPFNFRTSRGNSVAGNRSAIKYAGPGGMQAYIFDSAGEVWTGQDIVEYLLAFFAPSILGITSISGQYANLAQMTRAVACPRNVRAGLNAIISRSRGHGWRVIVSSAGVVSVGVYSAFDEEITAGSVKIAPATETVEVDGDADEVARVEVVSSQEHNFDRVIARGSPIVLCGTVDFSGGSPTLAAAWSGGQEAAYIAEADDKSRLADKYAHVYTAYRAVTANLPAGPSCNDDGSLDASGSPTQFYLGKSFLRQLPIQETDLDAAGPGDFRAPIVAGQYGSDYWLMDKPILIDGWKMSGFHVRMMDGEMGVRLTGGDVPHVLGENHFNGGTLMPEEIDYESIKATVAWTSSEELRVVRQIAGNLAGDCSRTLVIDVPDAECWYRLAGTMTDVVDGAVVSETDAAELRNDRAKLAAVAATAAAWYQRARSKVSVTWATLTFDFAPGALLKQITSQAGDVPVNAPITRVAWDLEGGTTTIRTDFGELDFVGMSGRGRRGGATLGATTLGAPPDVRDRAANLPVRQASGSGMAMGSMFDVLVWRDGGTTDGDSTTQCDRTYNVRTREATGPAAGGASLGTGMTPVLNRPTTGPLVIASTMGAGVVGFGYYDSTGSFVLYDANEALVTDACS